MGGDGPEAPGTFHPPTCPACLKFTGPGLCRSALNMLRASPKPRASLEAPFPPSRAYCGHMDKALDKSHVPDCDCGSTPRGCKKKKRLVSSEGTWQCAKAGHTRTRTCLTEAAEAPAVQANNNLSKVPDTPPGLGRDDTCQAREGETVIIPTCKCRQSGWEIQGHKKIFF